MAGGATWPPMTFDRQRARRPARHLRRQLGDPQLRGPLRRRGHPARRAVPRPLQLPCAQPAQGRGAERRGGAGSLQGARHRADRGRGHRRGQALHELRHVLRVRQLRDLLPAGRGLPGREGRAAPPAATWTPTMPSASVATSAPMSARPATSRWGWASNAHRSGGVDG